ncbi:Golgi resident protein GCP60-like, partial [Varroa destructor]|uniref:Golgi resident protein GCP60 n=1 Tax=Varroa destructor TaxID=109461 RepID=A0A7M7K5J0_VARDE
IVSGSDNGAPGTFASALTISPDIAPSTTTSDEFVAEWGFDLNELYRMARSFFCQNEGKAFHVSYEDKLKLIAYTQQERHGPYDEGKCEPVGYLDLIGQDRREAWLELGHMNAHTAKQEFVALLHDRCPLFRPFVCAHKASKQTKRNEHAPGAAGDTRSPDSSPSSPSHYPLLGTVDGTGPNETMIKAVLNQQTLEQFSTYAAQQAPNDERQQKTIIAQLQEEHFKQYMKTLAEQTAALSLNNGRRAQPTSTGLNTALTSGPVPSPVLSTSSPNHLQCGYSNSGGVSPQSMKTVITHSTELQLYEDSQQNNQHRPEVLISRPPHDASHHQVMMSTPSDRGQPDQTSQGSTPDQGASLLHQHQSHEHQHGHVHHGGSGDHAESQTGSGDAEDSDEDESSLVSIVDLSMWTRGDIVEFKECIRQEGGDSIIKVGHGETVTVRVPTHDDGHSIFWEFATDHYDIGFGLFFEWTKTPGSAVSVHISDSEDESCEEEEEHPGNDDVEAVKQAKDPEGPPTSIIVPIYRRDSHLEVYVGKHPYPGQGIYLLKFDNSYSLWRGKTLYYRVYYTR